MRINTIPYIKDAKGNLQKYGIVTLIQHGKEVDSYT